MTTFYKKRKIVERRNHERLLQQELQTNMQAQSDSTNYKQETLSLQISNLLRTNLLLLKSFDVSSTMMF